MSLFGSLFFDEDPFFSSHHRSMQRMMDSMNSSMIGFPSMMLPALEPPSRRQRSHGSNALMPFGFGVPAPQFSFPDMNSVFSGFEQMAHNSNMHSFSSSSVMTYTTDESGRPQLYQASSSSRTAPGGVKETKKSELDTRSGMQKMAIGRHIGERAHVVERTHNKRTGDQDENVEFINLDEDEADNFNAEWSQKTGRVRGHNRSLDTHSSHHPSYSSFQPIAAAPLAITDGHSKGTSKSRKRTRELS